MVHLLFAVEETQSSGIGALGISPSAFLIQLISFVIVFLLLKKFAFTPIVKLLEERRKTIENGVKAGQEFAKERAKMEKEHTEIVREARREADKIVANAHKEARDVIRDAEKVAARKSETMISDAEVRIHEETERAKRGLEKDIIGLVSEVTEAVVGEKIDAKKDGQIIDKILKARMAK